MSTYEELVERAAEECHFAYEAAAPKFGYETRADTAIPWSDLPNPRKAHMRYSVQAALDAAGVPALLAVYEAVLWERNLQEQWEATVDPETTPPLNRYGDPMDCDAWEYEFGAAEKALVAALERVRGQQ